MKRQFKQLLSIFLLSIVTPIYSQDFQRMLILAEDLNKVSFKQNQEIHKLNSKCLDETRKVPTTKESLSNILKGSDNVFVEFTDKKQIVPLSELLAKGKDKGIEILGSTENEQNLFALPSMLVEESPFTLNVKNNTGRPLQFFSSNDIQIGVEKEPSVQTFGASEQEEIWANTTLKKFHELKYLTTSEFNKYINDLTIEQRKRKVNEIFRKFEKENNIYPLSEEFINDKTKKTFNNLYNDYLKEDKDKISFFQKYDIGIKGNDSNELIEKYIQISNLNKEVSWKDLLNKIKSDYNEGIYYIYDKSTKSYLKFIRSNKIKGLLFKYTEFTKRNLSYLENRLYSRQINQNKIHILNFLSRTEDVETFKKLDELFPKNHSDFSPSELPKLKEKIKNNSIRYMFCFGHYSQGKIFTYVNGKKISYDIKLLNKIGKRLNVELFFIGCESSLATGGGSGVTININSIRILNNLFESLKKSSSLGTFLNSLGSKGKYEYAYEFEEAVGLERIHIYEKIETENGNAYFSESTPRINFTFPRHIIKQFHDQEDEDDE